MSTPAPGGASIAVGTPIAGRPPHKAERARFRHSASTVSVPASTGLARKLTIGMRLVHEAPEEREFGA